MLQGLLSGGGGTVDQKGRGPGRCLGAASWSLSAVVRGATMR